jgi:hypothetical protein
MIHICTTILLMPRKSHKKRKVVKNKMHRGFVALLLVALIVGLGLLMTGSFLKRENFAPISQAPAGDVITVAPQSSQNNLELKPLAFTSPTDCGYDSTIEGSCSCPTKMRWGSDRPGVYYYTDRAENECRFVSDGKVNEECEILKACETKIGACDFNAPSQPFPITPDSFCKVGKNLTGEPVGAAPPGYDGTLYINCGKWSQDLKSNNKTWCVGKPVIYLYPEKPKLVDVELFIPGEIYISIPKYPSGGWQNVLANPDGNLVYEGKNYKELYYETAVTVKKIPQNGIIIPIENLRSELSEIVTKLGLKASERDEFLEYWMPLLTDLEKPYIVFSLLDQDEKERIDGVDINPKPDVFINFIAYFKGIDKPFGIEPLTLPVPPQREGFTAVEWGGTIDPSGQ